MWRVVCKQYHFPPLEEAQRGHCYEHLLTGFRRKVLPCTSTSFDDANSCEWPPSAHDHKRRRIYQWLAISHVFLYIYTVVIQVFTPPQLQCYSGALHPSKSVHILPVIAQDRCAMVSSDFIFSAFHAKQSNSTMALLLQFISYLICCSAVV